MIDKIISFLKDLASNVGAILILIADTFIPTGSQADNILKEIAKVLMEFK